MFGISAQAKFKYVKNIIINVNWKNNFQKQQFSQIIPLLEIQYRCASDNKKEFV